MTESLPLQQSVDASLDQTLQQAIVHHQAGQLEDAERLYRTILQTQPQQPDANHNLGLLAVQVKQPAMGLPYLKAALMTNPGSWQYWISYIDALIQAGQLKVAQDMLSLGRKQGLQGEAVDALASRLETENSPIPIAKTNESNQRKPVKAAKATGQRGAQPSAQEVNTLVALFNQGRYAEGEVVARGLTTRFPHHGFGWKALGAVLKSSGRNEEALTVMRKAVELLPQDEEMQNNLGIVLADMGCLPEAEACHRRALGINPTSTAAHVNLGNLFKVQGRFAEAESSFRRLLELKPDLIDAYYNLGIVLMETGRFSDAEACYQRSLAIKPDHAEAYNNLGIALKEQCRFSDAEASFLRALTIKPDYTEAYSNLGLTLDAQGRYSEAETSYRRALEIKGDYAEVYNNLGLTLEVQNRLSEAEASYQRALDLKPNFVEAYSNLSNIYMKQGRLVDAEAGLRRALEFKPNYAEAYYNLGNLITKQGRLTEAQASYRRALELKPDFVGARSNLLFALNYMAKQSPSDCLAEALQYGRMLDRRAGNRFSAWACSPQPERLRVGIVSGDLRNHPVGYFLENVLKQIDSSRVELIGYHPHRTEDELTARVRPYFSAWKQIGQSDATAAKVIQGDGVHMLLDLSGHTADNRLPLFAWRPAPVQVSWLGYFATTGVAEMHYLLGDPYVTPAAEENHFSETVWRLPESYLCFTPPDVAVDVEPLPALATGTVTFGCFNNLTKMGDEVVALWARVLQAVPESRLFLKTKQLSDQAMRETTSQRFAVHGIAPYRLILEGDSPRIELLKAYHRVDIALDPFPYPGGTTSVEGLWMGVPVITRQGDRFLSHVGESIAHNAGLADWIAANDDAYVAKAVAYASNLERLACLRLGLRQQVLASPLFDASRFARHFEDALWGMWQHWQVNQGASA